MLRVGWIVTVDHDKHIEAFLNEARDVSSGIDSFVPQRLSAITLLTFIATIVGLLGVIGLVQGAIVPFFGLKISNIGTFQISFEHVAFIVSLLVSIAAFCFLFAYLIWKLADSEARLRILHAKYVSLVTGSSPIFQELRSHSYVLSNLSRVTSLTKELLDLEMKLSADEIGSTVATVLGDIKAVFDRITDDNCSVCIKLLNIEDGRLDVTTWMRDTKSTSDRGYVDTLEGTKNYDAYSNSAFREIIDTNIGKKHFLCNDLKSLSASGKYQNANPNWSDHYNAVLVVPLARERVPLDSFLGFLCVDNFKGDFDRNVGLPILNIYADIIQILILIVNIQSVKTDLDLDSEATNDSEDYQETKQDDSSGRRKFDRASSRKNRKAEI
jgi:hypothetical protein